MGPDFRVLVRKSRKQAEQYHRLYKVHHTMYCNILSSCSAYIWSIRFIYNVVSYTLEFDIGMDFIV